MFTTNMLKQKLFTAKQHVKSIQHVVLTGKIFWIQFGEIQIFPLFHFDATFRCTS